MSWKKYFKTVNASPLTAAGPKSSGNSDMKYGHYSSHLPDVYVGHPNRVERYTQYENMDSDSEVNSALDILSEFCTQTNVENGTSFDIHFHQPPSESETDLLKKQLINWNNLNDFDQRVFKIFRNTLKYGDQVFVRDPETFEWFWIDANKVTKVIVNESEGKEPEQYVIRDLNPNFQTLTATQTSFRDDYLGPNPKNQGYIQPSNIYGGQNEGGGAAGGRFEKSLNEAAVEAQHIVHLSLTEGLDGNWPFGTSILENIFKVFKQKELLEDAIIIYRIQRAPERRVFYVDVGNMPAHMAMAFVERVKNEIHQRRIPSNTGGGSNIMDTTYNPLSINEDYFFPQTAEGRGSKVETLPGGTNLGDIDDLRFFTNKLYRGLRIPSSYLPTGPDESPAAYADGRVGTAMIQEYRFNEYCKRLQRLVSAVFDREFKMFLKWRGFELDNANFELRFNEPQNFTKYRETEIDSSRIGTFTALEQYPYMSKRFLMERYLGLSEEEMQKNMDLWREENTDDVKADMPNMRSVGITPGGLETDLDSFAMSDTSAGGEEGVEAPEGEATDTESASPIPGTPGSIAAGGPATEEPPAGV
jgi:hypothetical protein